MKKDILHRVNEEKDFMINTKQTIREIAKEFNVSKSTVHKDLSQRLKTINPLEHQKVEQILKQHIDERHIRGGQSTKEKYKAMK